MTPAASVAVGGQDAVREQRDLVLMPGIGEADEEAADLGFCDLGPDIGQRHVAFVRCVVIAPAHMQPHALARDAGERAVQRGQ